MKNALREQMKSALSALSFSDLIEKSSLLRDQFFNHFVFPHASLFQKKSIVSYYPFSTEPQINIENESQNEPYQVAYVRIENWEKAIMTAALARRDQPDQWEEREFSSKVRIFQPLTSQPSCKNEQISVILVPGLAFTAQGARLGRGAGFYDRFLSANPEALRVGVGFQEQMVPKVPLQEWDESLDVILTDQNFFRTDRFSQWQKQGKVESRNP